MRFHRFAIWLQPENAVAASRHVRAFLVCDGSTLAAPILPAGNGPEDDFKLIQARRWRMSPAVASIIAQPLPARLRRRREHREEYAGIATSRARMIGHPHTLRHSCGFALADKGHDLRLIQDYLGHRDPRHTVHYTRTAGRRFEGLWGR